MEGEPTSTTPNESPEEIRPRIYVADLSAYNAGLLRGVWLEADQEPEEMHDQIAGMLAKSPEPFAEEWAIHDYEGWNGLKLGEWESLDRVSKIAKGIRVHGLAYARWAELVGNDEDLDQFEDHYLGRWGSRTEYAADILEDLGLLEYVDKLVPENLRPYVSVDAEAFGRDLELGGDITVVADGTYVDIFST